MLKRKLKQKIGAIDDATKSKQVANGLHSVTHSQNEAEPLVTSTLFSKPLWLSFFEIECILNLQLQELGTPIGIDCIYNPIEYAASIHCAYLRRYLGGRKKLVFVGMNPGPNGMNQTGVPFGNIRTVRELMELCGDVGQPPKLHPKRPVNGMMCKIEEPSGVRLWNLFKQLANESLDIFSQQCFVHSFCPLAFFDTAGKNITPSELKGELKLKIRDLCLSALDKQLFLLQPEVVVAVGDYVFTALKKSSYCKERVKTLRMPHPSPRAVNNHNWVEKAREFILQHDLLKYLRNEVVSA